MKKGIFNKIITGGLVVSATIGLTACGDDNKKPTITVDTTNYDSIYDLNETFTVEGLKLNIVKADGTRETVTITNDMIKSMPDMTTAGSKSVVIVYKGVEYTITIEVVAPEVEITSYNFSGYKVEYNVNEVFDISNLKLVLHKSDASQETINVTSSMIVTMPDMTSAGSKTVTIVYNNKNYNLSINVVEVVTITDYSFTGYKQEYAYAENFDISNLKLVLVMSDDTTQTIDISYPMILVIPNMSVAGEKTVTVNYNGTRYSFSFEVLEQVVVESSSFTGYNSQYYINSNLNISNLKLVLNMSNDTTQTINVTTSMIINMPDMSVAGNKTVIVNYDGVIYSFGFEVINPVLSHEITGYNSIYTEGDEFDISNLKLNLTRYDSSILQIAITTNMIETMPDMAVVGNKIVKVVYGGEIYTFTFNVVTAENKLAIQQFVQDYESKMDTSAIDFKLKRDIVARFMGKTAELKDNDYLTGGKFFGIDAQYDDLVNHLYRSVVKGAISSSTNFEKIKLDGYTADLKKLELLTGVATELTNFDYIRYAIDSIFTYENDSYINYITGYLGYWLNIQNSAGYDDLREVVEKHFVEFKTNLTIDFQQVCVDIIDVAKVYSSEEIKTLLNDIDYTDRESVSHIVSTLAEKYIKENYALASYENILENYSARDLYNNHCLYDVLIEKNYIATDITSIKFYNNLVDNQVGLIRLIEDALLSLSNPLDFNIIETLDNYIENRTYYNNLLNELHANEYSIVQYLEEDYYITMYGFNLDDDDQNIISVEYYLDLVSEIEYFTDIRNTIDSQGLLGAIEQYALVELALSYTDLGEEEREILTTVVYEYLNNLTISQENIEKLINSFNYTGWDVNAIIDLIKTNIDETGNAYLLSTIFDLFVDSNDEFSAEEIAVREDLRALLVYLDEAKSKFVGEEFLTLVQNCFASTKEFVRTIYPEKVSEIENLINMVTTIVDVRSFAQDLAGQYRELIIEKIYEFGENYLPVDGKVSALAEWYELVETNVDKFITGELNEIELIQELENYLNTYVVEAHRDVIIEEIYYTGLDLFDLEGPNDFEAQTEWLEIVETNVDRYFAGTLDYTQTASEVFEFVNNYCSEDRKTVINALSVLGMVLVGDEQIDYNELLSFIKLPEEIESIDYNKLVEKLLDENTYKTYSISDVKVDFIKDENGVITKETLTLVLDMDFDAMISTIEGTIELIYTIDFDAVATHNLDEHTVTNILVDGMDWCYARSGGIIEGVEIRRYRVIDDELYRTKFVGESASALKLTVNNTVFVDEDGNPVDFKLNNIDSDTYEGSNSWLNDANNKNTIYYNGAIGKGHLMDYLVDALEMNFIDERYNGYLKLQSYDVTIETIPLEDVEVGETLSAEKLEAIWGIKFNIVTPNNPLTLNFTIDELVPNERIVLNIPEIMLMATGSYEINIQIKNIHLLGLPPTAIEPDLSLINFDITAWSWGTNGTNEFWTYDYLMNNSLTECLDYGFITVDLDASVGNEWQGIPISFDMEISLIEY